jgi:hypothetical protein
MMFSRCLRLSFLPLPLCQVPYPKGLWHFGTDSGFRRANSVLAQLAQVHESLVNIDQSCFGILALMACFWVKLASICR